MRLLVDADACPVKDIIVRVAKAFRLEVIMFIDTSHVLEDGYSHVITVDKERDGVDIALINRAQKGDIVVTQDYGLAAMVLGKGGLAIHQNGLVYSAQNMDRLLFERHLGQKIRRAGKRTGTVRKRTKEDDQHFESSLRHLITQCGGN